MFTCKRLGATCCLILLGLLLPEIVAAQISGRVMFENGQPAAQVRVELRSFTDMGINQTVTDPSGNFSFSNVGQGVYYVTVRLSGYAEASERVEVGVFPTSAVFLYLRRPADKKGESPAPPAVSSEYLKIPAKAREQYERGMKLYQQENQLEKGLEHLRKAVELHPHFAEAQYGMGLLLMDLNRLEEAGDAFARAVAENEKLVPAYFPLGAILNHQREFQEAEKVLRKGLSFKEDIWQLHFELARAVAYQGRWQEAEAIAQRSAKLNEKAEKVQLLLANIYFELGKDQDALAAAERFLELAPNDPIAPQIRARVQAMRGTKPPW